MGRKPTRKTKALKAVKGYTEKGYSANKIQRLLKEQGLGMRRKRILQEVRLSKKIEVKKDRFKYTPKKFRVREKTVSPKPNMLFRVSLILNDVPVHSKPFRRNYLGFRLQAFHSDAKFLNSQISRLRDLLIDLVEKYLGYPSSEWWFSSSTYIGYEYATLVQVNNPYFLNSRWIFRVEREGIEVKSSSGAL